ncbi:hypothetical protein [Spirosoma sp. KNUC1025]|uniref:hypothetical protein n=1 Tax=Spirosoma sp. KNUC1025 TaxID=2894082 RepID=UPI00386BDC3D|nr:hypothetical protein LN737_28125 [Spirosoma sp. KNUC1025]
MILSFSALDDSSCPQDFSCELPELEDALDVLTMVAYQGNTILYAYILDEGKRTELPCDVFDGKPLSASLKRLEKQWQAVLKKPVRSSMLVSRRWLQDITRHRIQIYDNQITHFVTLLDKLAILRQRALAGHDGYRMNVLVSRYTSLIHNYEVYIDRAVAERNLVHKKLSQLEHSL